MPKSASFGCSQDKRGFTLVELLVVIAIIAVLSVAGVTIFTGVQKNARDSKRRADIEAIAKAYEVGYNGRYFVLNADSFSEGSLPDDPAKGDYFNWLDAEGRGFKVCASLENNPNAVCNTPAQNCYCQFSSQGTITPSSTPDSSSKQTNIGFGGSSASSCDPNGTLNAGLTAYWKMDENSGSATAADSVGNNNGIYLNGATTTSGKIGFGNAGSFDGSNDFISIPKISDFWNSDFTIGMWIYPKSLTGSPDAENSRGLFSQFNIAQDNGNNQIGFRWTDYNGAGSNKLWFYQTTPDVRLSSAGFSTLNQWYYIVLRRSANTGQFFINGAPSGQSGNFSNLNSSLINYPIYVGRVPSVNGNPGYFNGLIDDVRVYDRALSATEVQNLYNSGQGCIP